MSPVLKALDLAKVALPHWAYALLRKASLTRPRVSARIFYLSKTELSDEQEEKIQKHYSTLPGVIVSGEGARDTIPDGAHVIALGRETESWIASWPGKYDVHYLTHPAGLRETRQSEQSLAKSLDTIRKSVLESSQSETFVPALRASIRKADEAKRIVYSVVLDPYLFGDAQGDWIPPNEVENTAHDFLKSSRVIGREHEALASASVVESWIERYPSQEDYQKAIRGEPHKAYVLPFGDDKVTSGSWVIGIHLEGDAEWSAFQKGEIGAVSIGGTGIREPAKESDKPDVEFIEL